jgi:hypothetical protein
VQLLRVFTAAGYPLDADTWLRAFFAAGGEFDEATKVAKLIKEMQGAPSTASRRATGPTF